MILQNNLSPLLRLLRQLLFGGLYFYVLIHSYYEEFLFTTVLNYLLGFIFLLTSVAALLKDTEEFLRARKVVSLTPSVASMLLAAFILLGYRKMEQKLNAPSLLIAHSIGNFGGFNLDLKTDGTYVFTESGMGGVNRQFATYSIREALVILKQPIFNASMFRIKYNPSRLEYSKHLVAVDAKPHEYFAITLDRR